MSHSESGAIHCRSPLRSFCCWACWIARSCNTYVCAYTYTKANCGQFRCCMH